jgi:hypothetical protein
MSIMGWWFAVRGLRLAVCGYRRNLSGFTFPVSGLLAKLNSETSRETKKWVLQL